jgi:hypothetical protein
LDLEKAYYYVNLKFLLYLSKRCGFEEKLRAWIAHCISTVSFSILINGFPSGFFNSCRELRRGILYPLCCLQLLWRLSRMMFATMDKRLLSDFSVGLRNNDELLVSHLLF